MRVDGELEVRLQERAPAWVRAVRHAKAEGIVLLTTFTAFGDDEQLLADALTYAAQVGVGVDFADAVSPPDPRRS